MNTETRLQRLWEQIPFPTMLTLCLVALGIATAALWGWVVVVAFDLGVLLLCCLDYTRTFKSGAIEAERVCSPHFSSGIEHDIEIVLRNTGPADRKVQVRDQTPEEWEPAPVLKGLVPGRSILSLDYRLTPLQRGEYSFGDLFLRVEGPLGLIRKPLRLKASREVKVYPRLQPLRYADLATYRRVASKWGLRPTKWRGEGREFE